MHRVPLHRLFRGSLMLIAALSVACASPAPPAAPAAPAAGGGEAAAPVKPKVDRVVIAFRGLAAESATPRQVCCFDAYQFRPTHESLVSVDPKNGQPNRPNVATDWKLDETANTVTFNLRKGVKFHFDYPDLNAKDVVYSLESLELNDPPASASMNNWVVGWWRPFIKSAVAKSDTQVEFNVVPQAQFWYFFSDAFAQLPIRSKGQFDKEGEGKTPEAKGSAGTGPYQWKERKTSSYMRVERTPYKHWRATPDFPELEIRFINEPSTRMAGLVTGEIHITDVPSDLMPQAEKAGMKRIENQALGPKVMGTFICCFPDVTTKQFPKAPEVPLMDVRVREALNHAVNRDELGKAFAPRRQPMPLTHYAPSRPAWDPAYEAKFNDKYGFSPDRAKALLAEAGYTAAKPLEIDMFPSQLAYIANGPDINDAVAGYFRNVGVKVNYVQMDQATFNTQRNAGKFRNMVWMNSIGGNQLDGLTIWNLAGSGSAPASYLNQEVYNLRDEINKIMDPEKQVSVLKKIGDFGFNNYWDIPLWYVPLEVMINPKIVENWTYPGTVNGGWSHFENISAAK